VIACVSEKVDKRALAKRQLVPSSIQWKITPSRRVTVPLDVQIFQDSAHESEPPLAGPGDMFAGYGPCTCGIAINHPRYGRVVTTAGHGFQQEPGQTIEYPRTEARLVNARNVDKLGNTTTYSGYLVKSSITTDADYALIKPLIPSIGNYYRDQYEISGVVDPAAGDIRKRCYAMTSRARQPTLLSGIHGWLDIDGWPMSDLVLTTYVTQPGDSGCLLIDDQFRACGTLGGFVYVHGIKYSAFATVAKLLAAEQSNPV
jgi:hypothetical protein